MGIFIQYKQENEEKGRVTFLHYMPELLSEEELESGVIVSSVPEPEEKEAKIAILYINPKNNELWHEYEEAPTGSRTIESKVESMEEILKQFRNEEEVYSEALKSSQPLDVLKELKILVLKKQCSAAIYEGFTSGDNEFGFNEQDQVNFTQRLLTIVAGTEGPFQWKTKNNGVVELSKEEFTKVVQDAEAHKLVQQEKFWNLEQEVLEVETKEEVDAVKW